MTLINTIVAKDPTSSNCGGQAIIDGGDNLADCTSCGTVPNSLTGLDPNLASNGGPTQTHALLVGSSAIDAAGTCGLATDQRGFVRAVGPCDGRAYEFGASAPVPTPAVTSKSLIWLESLLLALGLFVRLRFRRRFSAAR